MSNVTDSWERQSRIAQAWERDPNADRATIEAAVDADLELEHAEHLERQAKATELSESLNAMAMTCPCCGHSKLPPAEVCDRCAPIVGAVRAERSASELVGNRSRRELVEAFLDRQD